ncbi:cytochrome P450 [Nocardia jejuensis]|uniref:cytochrome P450 n=1 Tax=Nocardia jejuensis TaxID=328049 RepID=UPI000833D5EC|nr:cytochrome P450 [Nocardia jejuensis]
MRPSDLPRDSRFYCATEPFQEQGILHFTRMSDVVEIFRLEKKGAFTTDFSYLLDFVGGLGMPTPARPHLNMLFPWTQGDQRVDGSPGRHAVLHGLLADYFGRRSIADLETTVRELTTRGVREGLENGSGEFDLVEFSSTLSSRVVSSLLGLPLDVAAIVREEVQAYERRPGFEALEPESPALRAFFQRLFDQEPDSGLLSDLSAACAAGTIDRDERDALVWGCWAAGLSTTATAICLLLGLAVEFDVLHTAAAADDRWLDAVAHETLRYATPFTLVPMYATRAVTLTGGTALSAGQPIHLALGAANRDPAVFGLDADTFEPARANAGGHIAFGVGMHRCLGDSLARLEMRTALRELARNLGPARVGEWRRDAGLLDRVAVARLDLRPGHVGNAVE